MEEERGPQSRRPRDPDTRARDHQQIDRLADDVLPDLIDRLTASGLAEIEVREDDWRIRLRLPAADGRARANAATATPATGARSGGVPDAVLAQTRPATATAATASAGNGAAHPSAPTRVIAVSPAVGIFQPRSDLRPGARVRQGDRLGTVDVLGLLQDVVAPEDGVVVDTMAEPGQGVEYGQDLVLIDPPRGRHGDPGVGPDPVGTPRMGES